MFEHITNALPQCSRVVSRVVKSAQARNNYYHASKKKPDGNKINPPIFRVIEKQTHKQWTYNLRDVLHGQKHTANAARYFFIVSQPFEKNIKVKINDWRDGKIGR